MEESEFNEPPLRWNVENRRYFEGDAWLPSSSVWVPRRVVPIELVARDPYSEYGRQRLYVDSESFLPLLKVVYDKAGELSKIVISSYGLNLSSDRKHRRAYPYYTIVVSDDASSMLRYHTVKYCQKEEGGIDYSGFDPSRLGPQQSVEEVAPVEGVKEGEASPTEVKQPVAESLHRDVPVVPEETSPDESDAPDEMVPDVPQPGGLAIE
jgi:hypothetical protein